MEGRKSKGEIKFLIFFFTVTLTDDEVSKLSPGAASASKLIKTGITLTGIYREHIKVVEELNMQRQENQRLEAYFNELVQVSAEMQQKTMKVMWAKSILRKIVNSGSFCAGHPTKSANSAPAAWGLRASTGHFRKTQATAHWCWQGTARNKVFII